MFGITGCSTSRLMDQVNFGHNASSHKTRHSFRKTDVSHKTTRTVAMRQQVTTERIEMDGRVCGRPLYILKQ